MLEGAADDDTATLADCRAAARRGSSLGWATDVTPALGASAAPPSLVIQAGSVAARPLPAIPSSGCLSKTRRDQIDHDGLVGENKANSALGSKNKIIPARNWLLDVTKHSL